MNKSLGLQYMVTIYGSTDELAKNVSPLPKMPVLGSSSSAANKDIMSKIWTNGGTII